MDNKLVLLDTSILIDYYRKTDKNNAAWISLIRQGYDFAVSAITKYEIHSGATHEQKSFWNSIFENIPVISFDENCVDTSPDHQSPDHPIIQSPNHQSPNHPITQSPNHPITKHPITQSPNHPITNHPITQSPITRSPNHQSPDHPITQSPITQSPITRSPDHPITDH